MEHDQDVIKSASNTEGFMVIEDGASEIGVVEGAIHPAKETEKKRDIKGGLPYTTTAGSFKKALDGIIVAERPEKIFRRFS